MRLPQSIFSGVVIAIVALTGLPFLAEAKPLRADIDGDGLSTWTETRRVGTNPRRADTDRDRLWDGTEVKRTKTNPLRVDTDRDGLSDWTELRRTTTNPRKADSDGDGVDDGEEILTGSDPRDPASVPGFPPNSPPDPVPTPGPSPPATEEPEKPPPPPPPPDTTPPHTTLALKPSALTKNATAKFEFSGSDVGGSGVASFECRRDGGAWSACRSPKEYTGLSEGTHNFEVKAVDNAGNVDLSPASFNWTVDTTAPQPAIDSLSKSLLRSGETSDLTWHANENGSFELRVGGGDCTAGTVVDSGPYANKPATDVSSVSAAQLTEGSNTLRLCLTDAAGNRGQATTTVSKDTGAPETQINAKPAALTNSTAASFSFTGSDPGGSGVASFECRRDGGAWATCPSPKEYTGLTEGSHSFEVKAIDQASNVDASPVSSNWQVDTTPPPAQITSGPSGLTNDSTPTYGFSAEAGVSFECSIDEGTPVFGPCSGSTSHTPSNPLSEGPHTFRVRATDAAANQATATRSFNIDTTAPSAPELTATVPASPANGNSPQVLGTAPADTTVKLYTGTDCTGPPAATTSAAQLAAGIAVSVPDDSTTVFRATGTTAVGNTSGCSEPLAYVEDSGPPGTTIETKPPALTNSAAASFTFSGNDGAGSGIASFECRRDGGVWAACPSPKEYTGLSEGNHSFEVKAVDQAENFDLSPASFSWTIDLTAPQPVIDSASKALLKAGEASDITWHANENGAFELRVGGIDCTAGTVINSGLYAGQPATDVSSVAAAQLAEGSNTLRLCLTDAAGNRGQATTTLSKDTGAPETTITLKPAALANSATAKFEFSGNDGGGSGVASFECRRDGGTWAACPSPKEYAGLGDGSHSFEVKAIDQAGNVDPGPASFTWTIDTTPPSLQITLGPSGLTNDSTPTFGFSAEPGVSFECSIDESAPAFGPCSGATSHTPAVPLSDGPHTFRVRAGDAATNQATATRSFNVDTAAPPAPELSATVPPSPANDNTPQIVGTAPAGTSVKLYGSAACTGSPLATVTAAELGGGIEVSVPDNSSTTFGATTTTAAENVSGCSEPLTYVEDSAAPDTQINIKPNALTNSSAASFGFSGNDGAGSVASFECRRDSGTWAACPSPKEYTGLAEGSHSFDVKAIDQAGNVDPSPASFNWTIDLTTPQPAIDSVSKALLRAGETSDLTWHANENGAFELRIGGADCTTGAVIDSGPYAGQPATDVSSVAAAQLAEGSNTLRLCLTDGAGNRGLVTTSVSKDTAAPDTQITTKPNAPTNSTTAIFAFSGSDPGGSGLAFFECRRDGGTWAACPSPKEYVGLAESAHSFEVKAIDSAGNVDASAATFNWTIDTTAPETTITLKPASLTNSASVKFEFSGNDGAGSGLAFFECRRDGGTWAACPSPREYTGLSEGAHSFEVKAIDQAGNVDSTPATFSWTVDTTAPETTINTKPAALTNITNASFGFNGSDPAGSGVASFECRRDGGAWASCPPPKEYTGLVEGNHSFEVKAIDLAGNVDPSPATFNWMIDLAAPQPAIDSLSKSLLKTGQSSNLTWHANENGSFELRVGGSSCTGGAVIDSGPYANKPATDVSTISATQLAEGSNTLRLCLTDGAGNRGQVTTTLSKDTGAPNTMITLKPSALTNSPNAKFEFSGSDGAGSGVASLECRRDGGAWAFCTSPREYTGLAGGVHTFEVKAIDQAGNVDSTPATSSWTIDTATPETTITLKPATLTNSATAKFEFSGNDGGGSGLASFECRRDGGVWATCTSPREYASLVEGTHSFEVKAVDQAGNVDPSPATFNWTVDTSAPDTAITLKPPAPTNSATAKFEFSGSDGAGSGIASFECRRDGGVWAACPSPKEYTGLAEGSHSFDVKAIDQAGNVDPSPASFNWTIDLTTPQPAIDSVSKALLRAGETSDLTWHANENGAFELRIGGADCTTGAVIDSGPYAGQPATDVSSVAAAQLAEGSNTLRLCLTDGAGNRGLVTTSVSKDTAAPDTQITTKPNAPTNSTTAIFAFSGSDPGGSGLAFFECRRDGGTWAACPSPKEYVGLAESAHSFEVKAIDSAGNVDASAATFNWTIDTTAPETTITLKPASLTNSASVKFEFSGNDGAGSGLAFFECRRDGGTWAACPSPKEYVGLAEGAHSFEVKAIDLAGNVDASAASFNWTVDTAAPDTQINTKPAGLTTSTTASFTFSGNDGTGSGVASFECRRDGGTWAVCPSPREYTGLADGAHSFEVKAIDQAVNVDSSPASFNWTVDTTPPAVQITLGPSGLTNDSTPTFGFSSEPGASFECSIDESAPAFGPCSGANSHTPAAPLADGPHTFRVRATDAATNQAIATRSFNVDTAAPPAPELTQTVPPSPANDNTPQIVGTAPAGTTVTLYGNAACSGSPLATVTAAELGGGIEVSVPDNSSTTFGATTTTAAENVSGCSEPLTYLEDSAAPDTQINIKPNALTNSSAASFGFSGDDGAGSGVASFECRRDGGAWAACPSPKEYTGLSEGAHSFEVKAIDQAGNVDPSPATFNWQIDLTAPQPVIDSVSKTLLKAGETSDLTWHANENGSFELRVGGADCTTGTVIDSGPYANKPATDVSSVSAAQLQEGANTLRLCLTNGAGNRGQVSTTLSKDTGTPETTITLKPASPTAGANAKFEFSGNDPGGSGVVSFECRRDGGAWAVCTSPREYTGLADGSHSFEVKAIDQAGNVDPSPATFNWTVDTSAPETTIALKPPALTNSANASFSFTGNDGAGSGVASFECRRDGGTWAACPSPKEYVGLSEGAHSFEVKTVDQAGNVDPSPASFNWTIDLTTPHPVIDSVSKALLKAGQSSDLTWHANENGSFELRVGGADCTTGTVLDSGTYANQPATHVSSVTATQLAEGSNTLRICLTTQAGNSGQATTTLNKDTAAPDTTIVLKPALLAKSASAKFGFSGNDGSGSGIASLECRRDGGTWAVCTSPKQYSNLSEGAHSFEVKAIDQAGNVDGTPATFAWTIDSDAPDTTIQTKPPTATTNTEATFTFSGSDSGGSGVAFFECRRDGAVWAICTSPKEFTGLAEGAHIFEVKAVDQAGNVDPIPASFDWQVDNTPPALQIVSGPSGLTNNPTPTYGFSSEPGVSFECSIDEGTPAFGPCSGATSHMPVSPLSDGPHTFRVRATDAAANQSTVTRSFIVDTTATPTPELTVTAPVSPANENNPRIFGSAPANTTVRLYTSAECTGSPVATASAAELAAGIVVPVSDDSTTTFRATATTAGESPSGCSEQRTYVEDSTAPETTFVASPPPATTSTSASFFFAAGEPGSSFECRVEAGAFAACTSPVSFADLTVGGHSFSVRATDAAGNVDSTPVERSWTVESPPSSLPSGCGAGSTAATTAAQVRSAVQAGKDVCVTADVGNVDLSDLGSRPVIVSTNGGSMGEVDLTSTTDLTIVAARFRSIEMRGSHRTRLLGNTIGGTQTNRVPDQLIFMPTTSNDVAIEGNDIGWTIADESGNTGYGCRCYGDLNRLRFIGNRIHDVAADGFQGVGGTDVLIDRNEIGPVGRNPDSDEHSDSIQITGNDANLRITNNWIHHQGYFEGEITANAGSTYIHGGSAASLVYENNLIQTAQGRTEICGLGTGGEERSNLTIRRNTWVDGGLAFNGFPGFEWDCDSGTGNTVERNIAVDADGGLKMSSSPGAAAFSANLFGQLSLVTLDAAGNCTSANCNPAGEDPIGYRKASGVAW